MADKSKHLSVQSGQKVISMKLFATWEVEKSSPNCIPRICSLKLTRLIVLKSLESELASVIIAMKMQSSKRILRSNEIAIPSGVTAEVQLDLSFIMQYPHFLKRDGNKLQVMLQRRKRYKNRPIIGYKTLALGQLSMAQVLQHSENQEMLMYANKDHKTAVAKVVMLNICSSPVDHEENHNGRRKLAPTDADRSPEIDPDSDDDDNDEENWSNDELSDSEPTMLGDHTHQRGVNRSKVRPAMNRQRNLKQKFVALLKRFKMSDEVLDSEVDHELGDQGNPEDIDDLIEHLEDLSDSEPEFDKLSVMSTPKPRLRPFFTGSGHDIDNQSFTDFPKKITHSDDSSNSQERDTEPENYDATMTTSLDVPTESVKLETHYGKTHIKLTTVQQRPRPPERRSSYQEDKEKKKPPIFERSNSIGWVDQLPRKALLDQLTVVLSGADDKLPNSFFLVNTAEWQGQLLVQKLQEKQLRIICTCSESDVRATINFLVSKIQKFSNYNSRSAHVTKIGIAGGDAYINSVLRPYVEQFSLKSPDWQNFVKFLIIPLGSCAVGRYLSHVDSTYDSLFMDQPWRETFEKLDAKQLESQEVVNRVSKYLSNAGGVVLIPIAEAMVMCKGKSNEEESTQKFVPFLNEVSLGNKELLTNVNVEAEESTSQPQLSSVSTSPPQTLNASEKLMHTPPSSPNVAGSSMPTSQVQPTVNQMSSNNTREYYELQVDYWTVSKQDPSDKGDKSSKKEGNKSSLKSAFKALQVLRLCSVHQNIPQLDQPYPFQLTVVSKEKKQKIRIGKKSKESETKMSVFEGINRLICTSKSQNHSLAVTVDGVDWCGVKFFQLSSQWQTHIKHFPICLFVEPNLIT